MPRAAKISSAIVLAALLASCRNDMRDQAKHRPLDASAFFADGRSSRPLVEGTIPRGFLRADAHLYAGKTGAEFATEFPFPVTRALLERGRERYGIFCTPCHDQTGSGNGIVVQRGLRKPPSFHIQRLHDAPSGYLFDVITNGFGAMQSYASMIPVEDRWAIVSYMRALQLSQDATIEDVPVAQRAQLEAGD
jgi:hypothetical protein